METDSVESNGEFALADSDPTYEAWKLSNTGILRVNFREFRSYLRGMETQEIKKRNMWM